MSWITLQDVVNAFVFAVENDALRGPVNLVAPNPVTNEEFTKALGEALNRPTIVPVPEFAIKLLYGEMGETLVLGGNRVLPKRLEAAGFQFEDTDVRKALRKALD